MTKSEFCALVTDQLAGGDLSDEQTRRFHPTIVERNIEVALEQALLGQGFVGTIPFWKLDALTKRYTVDVACDEDTGEIYADMPAATMILSQNQQIREIVSITDLNALFVPRAGNMKKLFETLPGNAVGSYISYSIVGNRIYFGNRMREDAGSLIFSLVVKFSEWDDDEEVNIPADKVQQVLTSVMQIMGVKPKEDAINDNAT